MKKDSVVIIFGGYSTEHYVSCESGANILRHIDKEKYNVHTLGITLDGEWVLTDATVEEIEDGTSWLEKSGNKKAIINPVRNSSSLLVFNDDNTVSELHIDCIIPIIHGHGGEDGSIQGIFEFANIPYVGCGIAASACGMDKQLTRLFADSVGVRRPRSIDVFEETYEENILKENNLDKYNYPVFVKAANGGSSVGVIKVNKYEELNDAIKDCFKYEEKVLVEEGIIGREINATVLGNEELEFGELCEIVMNKDDMFDYASKYINHNSSKQVPADVTADQAAEIRCMAEKIYHALGCENIARVDFFIDDKSGEVYFGEINTLPGLRAGGIVPEVFEAQGISFTTVITKLINYAYEKKEKIHNVDKNEIKIR